MPSLRSIFSTCLLALLAAPLVGVSHLHARPPATDTKSALVFITRTGKRFHREGCSSLSHSRIPMKRSEALAQGYTPCQRCRP